MQTLGAASAVGMLIAGIATWVILPTVLLHQKPLKGRRNRSHEWTHRILSRLRGWPSITIAVVLIAAFVPGVLMVRANFSMVDIYRRGTEVRKNLELMTDIVGGSIPVYLTYPADGSFDPATAAAVLEFQDRVVDGGIVGRAVSAYDIIRTQWENATGNTGYPERQVLARTIATRIKLTNPTALDMFFSEDDTGRAVFFLRDLDDATLTAFLTTVDEVAASTGLAMRPVGTAFVMKAMNDQIIPQQVTSLLLAAAMVFVLISITQRSLKLGIAATIPILITLVVLFGVMGYARIDLSVITGIMSGLTIGVGIDYAIHYVALLRQARRRGESDPPDVALRYVATPVLANALGLAIGFTAMVSSPLQIHVTLSILMWVTMIVSAGLSLTFLPTITSRRPLAAHVREGGELRKPEGARDE
jgi:predicted RND superfamily exporter protein